MEDDYEVNVFLSPTEIAGLATMLIERIYLYHRTAPEAYANNVIPKDADFYVCKAMELTENILQKLLKHLPDDFRQKMEKKVAETHEKDPSEVLDDMAKMGREME